MCSAHVVALLGSLRWELGWESLARGHKMPPPLAGTGTYTVPSLFPSSLCHLPLRLDFCPSHILSFEHNSAAFCVLQRIAVAKPSGMWLKEPRGFIDQTSATSGQYNTGQWCPCSGEPLQGVGSSSETWEFLRVQLKSSTRPQNLAHSVVMHTEAVL